MPTALVLLFFAGAPNVDLEWARQLSHGVRYAAALEALKKAEAREGNSTADLAEIFELQGLAHAALKHPDDARKAFTRLLAVNPHHKFAAAQAPRVMTPYFEARSQVQQHAAIGLSVGPPAFGEGKVSVTVDISDFLGLGRTLAVKLVEDGVAREASFPWGASVRVEAKGAHVEISAELLGEHRAVLATLPAQVFEAPKPVVLAPPPAPVPEPMVAPATPVVEARPERSRGPLVAGLVLAAVGVAAIGTGAYFGASSKAARAQYDMAMRQSAVTLTYAQGMALSGTAQTDAVVANVLFAAGGALALAGVGITIGSLVISPAPGGVSVSGAMP